MKTCNKDIRRYTVGMFAVTRPIVNMIMPSSLIWLHYTIVQLSVASTFYYLECSEYAIVKSDLLWIKILLLMHTHSIEKLMSSLH